MTTALIEQDIDGVNVVFFWRVEKNLDATAVAKLGAWEKENSFLSQWYTSKYVAQRML